SSPEARIKAAEKIRDFGPEKGQKASKALCQAIANLGDGPNNRKVGLACLDSLRVVDKSLYPHLSTLLNNQNGADHYEAVREIGKLGTKAKPAVPIMVKYLQARLKSVGQYNDIVDIHFDHRSPYFIPIINDYQEGRRLPYTRTVEGTSA